MINVMIEDNNAQLLAPELRCIKKLAKPVTKGISISKRGIISVYFLVLFFIFFEPCFLLSPDRSLRRTLVLKEWKATGHALYFQPTSIPTVQVSDTTGDAQRTKAGY